jgi:biopolymer transport protein ExbB
MNSYRILTGLTAALLSLPLFAAAPTQNADLVKAATQQLDSAREAAFRGDLAAQMDIYRAADASRNDAREESERLRETFATNEKALADASEALRLRTGSLGEMFGIVRQTATDLQSVTDNSIVRIDHPDIAANLAALSEARELPQLTELKQLWEALRDEARWSGEISSTEVDAVYPNGELTNTQVIRIGTFNLISADGYLTLDDEMKALSLLPRQPTEAALIDNYLASDVAPVAIDPSRGGLLSLTAESPTFVDRLRQGGMVGYLIIFIGAVGAAIAAWRLIALRLTGSAVRNQLRTLEAPSPDNALGRILIARGSDNDDQELLEARMDEAVLKELPGIERGQSIIRLLAAIAPLLGLLGTVTGMIATFQAITVFGSGDPKLMAGGISQALVTTELGLIVAVPLLLLHSWVASQSRGLVQVLDEQSAGLIAEAAEKRESC